MEVREGVIKTGIVSVHKGLKTIKRKCMGIGQVMI